LNAILPHCFYFTTDAPVNPPIRPPHKPYRLVRNTFSGHSHRFPHRSGYSTPFLLAKTHTRLPSVPDRRLLLPTPDRLPIRLTHTGISSGSTHSPASPVSLPSSGESGIMFICSDPATRGTPGRFPETHYHRARAKPCERTPHSRYLRKVPLHNTGPGRSPHVPVLPRRDKSPGVPLPAVSIS
jgi:hypothetical protein